MPTQATQVDLSTRNTLGEQLANINLSQENVLSILTGLNKLMTGESEIVDIVVRNQDGTTDTLSLRSNAYLLSEITRLSKTMSEISNLNPDSAATIIDESGQHRRIFVTGYNNTLPGNVNNITRVDEVSVDNKSLIYELMFPSTSVVFTLPHDFLLVDQVLVKTFRFDDTTNFERVYEGMTYAEAVTLSKQNRISGKWYEDVYDTKKREQRYYGSFNVLSVNDISADGAVTALLSDTHYSDADSIEATRELFAGDYLTNKDGNAKYQIISVDHFKKTVKLKQIAGIASVQVGIGTLQYLYTITDETRELHIPIHGSEKSVVFFLPVNPLNGATGAISHGHIIDTATLIVYEGGTPYPFDTYFTNKVTNIGSYLEQLVSDSAIPFSKGIKPSKPVLKTDFFTVMQINKHLSDNSAVDNIEKLADEKEKVFSDLANINSQISTVNSRINAGRYRSLADRSADENKLNNLLSQKKQLTALYASLVKDISSKTIDDDLSNFTPKFRVRGFFPVQNPILSPDTRAQHIIKYKIEYRYCTPTTDISTATTLKYTSESGDELHGIFSSWIQQESPVLQKVKNPDGTITWAANNTEDGNEININQVDIPIRPNESVEIRVKALSEAGYPTTYTESDWSDVIRINFPAALQSFTTIASTVEKNIADQQKVQVQQMLTDIGIDDHLFTSYKEQDKYFAHTAHVIASGFRSSEQSTISLFEYLTTLTNRIQTLQSRLDQSSLNATIEIVDEDGNSYTVQNFSTIQLFAGAYTDSVAFTDTSKWGTILEKRFYIKITNKNSASIDLLSPCNGSLTEQVNPDDTAEFYYPLVAISDTSKVQAPYYGQIIYSRLKDLADQTVGSNLYISNAPGSNNNKPTDTPESTSDVYGFDGTSALTEYKFVPSNKDVVAVAKTAPLNEEHIKAELLRLKKFNEYLRAQNIQNATPTTSETENYTGFIDNDRYAVGQNTCGAFLFPEFTNVQNIQVNGSNSAAVRILNPGDENAILIPVKFQFRMIDAIGNINGETRMYSENITYRKKIGLTLLIGQNPFRFDMEVYCRLRSSSVNISQATRLNQIQDQINTSDQITPTIQ